MSATAIVRGQVDTGKPGAAARRIVVVEETLAGYRLDGDGPCQTSWPRVRVVGIADTDADGRFSIEYVPSEAPPDACDWKASVRVDVYDGSTFEWTSPARHLDPVVEFRPDGGQRALASVGNCVVGGRLTACGRPAANLDVVVTEKVTVGIDQPGEPCIPHSHTRPVGQTVTDSAGGFTVAFQPTLVTDHCHFPSDVQVDVFDGPTLLWQSGLRLIGAEVTVDAEIFADCPAGASLVRVYDDDGARVAGAEVYLDGARVGTTDALGQLPILPPLVSGQLLAARKLIHEQPTGRQRHARGGTTNWAYRVYITSVRVRYDTNGGSVRLPLQAVTDPGQPVDLRVQRRNTLIGFNFIASIEWNTSPQEHARLHDRLVELSELLYNGTDGQFAIERLLLAESAGGWDYADIRIYANLNQPSEADVSGVFGQSGVVRMNPNDAYYAGVPLHELGHYVLGVLDEYKGPDGPATCTLQSGKPGTSFSDGGDKDSCFMRGAQEMNKKKLCSAHPDNPHAHGTNQGPQDCWSGALGRYGGQPDERWRLQSPSTRGVIVGRLPDSGVPVDRTTQPIGSDTQVPSFIPVAEWKPRVDLLVDHRGVLVDGVVVRTEFEGAPVRRQKVWLHSNATGSKLLQGVTKNAYNLAYGLSTGDGEIPLRGAHVDDEIVVIGPAPGGLFVGTAKITQAEPHTLVIPLSRIPLLLATELKPRGVGAFGIQVRPTAIARVAARPPDVYVVGNDTAGDRPSYTHLRLTNGTAVVGGLAGDGTAVVVIVTVTADGDVFMDERGVALYTADDEPTELRSSDGTLKLSLQGDTFSVSHQVLIESPGVDSPANTPLGEVVSGPYRITTAPDDGWSRHVELFFRLPTAELPERDSDLWISSLVVAELEPLSGEWRELGSTGRRDPAFVSTRIDHGGTYALIQRSY